MDFAKYLGKHNNTVDGWFKNLEERRLHCISRINGEKVYDELDLAIATHIIQHRNQKWSLDAIFDNLPKHFDLRPFPLEFEEEEQHSVKVIMDFDKMRATLLNDMQRVFEEVAVAQVEKQIEHIKNLSPSPEQQRLERFNMLIAERRVMRELEKEALSLWLEKPLEDRQIKIGWFRKVEDLEKRDRFIKEYKDKHFESRMKKEYELD